MVLAKSNCSKNDCIQINGIAANNNTIIFNYTKYNYKIKYNLYDEGSHKHHNLFYNRILHTTHANFLIIVGPSLNRGV